MSTSPCFKYGKKEIEYLKLQDEQLAAVIDRIGKIQRPVIPDLFTALVHSIIGQQISAKAMQTVWRRMMDKLGAVTPQCIAEIPDAELQACGMSHRKVAYIQEIAGAVLNGTLDLDALSNMPDEEVCQHLIRIKGIGKWTAEMLMIFSMQRPDILSADDLAIQRGLCKLYHHRKITPQLLAKYKKRYSPYATVASLYLWELAGERNILSHGGSFKSPR